MKNFNICPYCGKPAGKSELGFLLAVHPEHGAGTQFWAKWYGRERSAGRYRTEIGDILYEMCARGAPNTNAGLAAMHALQQEKKRRKEELEKEGQNV